MTITRKTTYTLKDGDHTFPVQFEPIDGTEIVHIAGDTATVGYLVQDESTSGWYFDDNDQGEFYGYDPHMHGHNPQSREEVAELASLNPGRCFWIHKYEHGQVRYYRAGAAITPAVELRDTEPAEPGLFIPDQQWDVSRGAALYIAPEDAPEPEEYCDTVMQEFSDWCNGSIYGVVVERYTRDGDVQDWQRTGDSDACWGHIGYDWAQQALKEEMPKVDANA